MRKNAFIIYAWITTIAWYLVILLFSTVEGVDLIQDYSNLFITTIAYQLAYGFLFLLIFRAMLITLKLKVERLLFWKTKREKAEDEEFAVIVEVLVVIIALVSTTLLAALDEFNQLNVVGRVGHINDVFVALSGALMFAVIVFVIPHATEIEARIAKLPSSRKVSSKTNKKSKAVSKKKSSSKKKPTPKNKN